MVSFTPRPLCPQKKSPWYPLDRRLGGPRALLDTVVKRKIPSPHQESNPRTLIIQPMAQCYTELSQLCGQDVLHINAKIFQGFFF
jgi:hypothetical protein